MREGRERGAVCRTLPCPMIGALPSTLIICTIPQSQSESERIRPFIFLHLGFIPTPYPRFVPLDRINA